MIAALAVVALKTSVVLLAALAAVALLARRSAAVRHWVLALAFAACAALPALHLLAPAWTLPLDLLAGPSLVTSTVRWTATAPDVGPAAATAAAPAARPRLPVTIAGALAAAWLTGSLAAAGLWLASLLGLRRLVHRSHDCRDERWQRHLQDVAAQAGIRRPVRLLLGDDQAILATWGWRRPHLLLPAAAVTWTDERIHVVLGHELAHVARGDWAWQTFTGALTALHWWNPLVHVAARRLRLESERACDDQVLAAGANRTDYASHLLDIARENASPARLSPAVAFTHPSTLEGRIRAMLNDRLNREPLRGPARVAALVFVSAVVLPVGLVSLSARTAEPAPDVAVAPPAAAPDAGMSAASPAPPPAAPQAPAASIQGVLYDPFGGLLPGAAVYLTSSSGVRYDVATDPSGAFTFPNLPPGQYQLVTSLPGFATVTNVVRVDAGQTLRRQIVLPLGQLQETITVVCQAGVTPGEAKRISWGRSATVSQPTPSLFSGGIGGQVRPPSKLTNVNPVCPRAAEPIDTVVSLVGRIGIDGLVTDLRDVTEPAAQAVIVASATEAVRQWEFTATRLNDTPIEATINISVRYSWKN